MAAAITALAPGTPVPAMYGGRVFRSGYVNGYGMTVVIETQTPKGAFYSLYAHLGPDGLPKVGAQVRPDEPIGNVGTLKFNQDLGANVDGPHLHLEIIHGGEHGATLHESGGLGIVSSDRTHRADPETFDIDNPVFPYENGGVPPTPSLRSSPPAAPSRPPSSAPPNSPGPLNILPDLPDDAPPADPVPPRPNPAPLPPIHLLRFNPSRGSLGGAVVPGQLPPAVPGALLDDGFPDDWHVPPSAQDDSFPDDWYVPASAMAPNAAPPARSAQQSLADPTGSYQQPAQGRFANLSDAEINSAFVEYYRLKSGVDAPSVRDTLGLYPMPSPLSGLPGARPQPAGGSLFSTLFGGAPKLSAASLFGGDADLRPWRFASAQPASASPPSAANWGSTRVPPDPTAVPYPSWRPFSARCPRAV